MNFNYRSLITNIENFPVEGVYFKDISPLLASRYFKNLITEMGDLVEKPDFWVGVESRGFIFASALAIEFGGGVVLCRKAGKLPGKVITKFYTTEYSTDQLSIKKGSGSVVIVDDVIATGGTLATVNKLCISAGYNVLDNLVLIDLRYVPRNQHFLSAGLNNIKSLIIYD